MLRPDLVLIGLSPGALRLATVRGSRLTQVEHVRLDPASWTTSWENGLHDLEKPLNGALAAGGVRAGSRARVIYTAPGTFVDCTSVPLHGARALQAAHLMLRESTTDGASRVTSACPVLREDASEFQGVLDPARSHVLLAGEQVSHVEAIGGLMIRAGLTIDSLVPARSLLASAAIRAAASCPDDGAHALVWIDSHTTIIVAKNRGRMLFVRMLDLGAAPLAQAFERAAANAGRPMHADAAMALLMTVGVPARGTLVDPATGLKAESVLPLMQSILQRFIVETKQSLRFGLPEGDLARATVHLAGPGAEVPGLGAMFAGELDWAVSRAEGHAAGPSSSGGIPDPAGELAHAITAFHRSMALLPPSEARRREETALRRAVWTGALAAFAVVGGLWYQARARLAETESRTAMLESRVAAVRSQRELRELAAATSAELVSATGAVIQAMPARPHWKATLANLTQIVGPDIELAEVAGSPAKDGTSSSILTLRGTSWPAEDARSAEDVLAGLIDRLSKSPLVESARMVSTRSEFAAGQEVKQFTIAVTLRTLPVPMPGLRHAALDPEAAP